MTRRGFALTLGLLGVGLGILAFTSPGRSAEPKELVVFAAASLRDVFQNLAVTFEKKHPGVKVRLSFAGSQELRVQIENGARADVFASADEKHMAALLQQGLAQGPAVIFAHNEPVVVVRAPNPAKLRSFTDLPRAKHIVVGASEVPIGAYTESILASAEKTYGKALREQIVAHISSRELNVRQVLTKVALGEADAGIVYKTDALAAQDRVSMIEIPAGINVTADYPIAMLAAAPHPDLAKAWVAAVLAQEGQDALAAALFKPVSAIKTTKGEK
ncbi:MAG TPA: molybdate ABC transporter substrate-binding protein [Polyangia bacterium]